MSCHFTSMFRSEPAFVIRNSGPPSIQAAGAGRIRSGSTAHASPSMRCIAPLTNSKITCVAAAPSVMYRAPPGSRSSATSVESCCVSCSVISSNSRHAFCGAIMPSMRSVSSEKTTGTT